ncbi:MAG TPA: aminoacyl-tRNA hydrolase [Solirubrobacteraceae bacterium]|nr:aminoacyl-tRNA hydrolase [Solirubrobacteraceae bacterium]
MRRPFPPRGRGRGSGDAAVDWLIVGLGNPGREYAGTRHNVGFMVAEALVERWGLGRAKDRFRGRLAEGRARGDGGDGVPAAGPRVAVLCPQTYMNDAGRSVGPARGALKLPLERVLVVHDEIDLPFGEVRTRLGGGLAGHNGLKSLKRELGGADFMRVRVGVGRPDSTDPEIVAAYVLGRFREDDAQVRELVERACEHVERAVTGQEAVA